MATGDALVGHLRLALELLDPLLEAGELVAALERRGRPFDPEDVALDPELAERPLVGVVGLHLGQVAHGIDEGLAVHHEDGVVGRAL